MQAVGTAMADHTISIMQSCIGKLTYFLLFTVIIKDMVHYQRNGHFCRYYTLKWARDIIK